MPKLPPTWNEEQIARVVELKQAGKTNSEIAWDVGDERAITASAVDNLLRRLKRRRLRHRDCPV